VDKLIQYVTERISQVTANVYDDQSTTMVATRLKRRMLELNIETPQEYLTFLENHYDEEEPILVDLLTTHHTFLFREIIHFEYLKVNLDQIISNVRAQGRNKIRVWSAAASTGQEAYSLALFLDQELKNKSPAIGYEILGTDVAPQTVQIASQGIYPYQKVKEIPAHYFSGYWTRLNNSEDTAEISLAIKSNCKFEVHNILNPLIHHDSFDLVFCRNVFIYFSDENIKKAIQNLEKKLAKNGFLFTGVSEPIGSYTDAFEKVGPCIYNRKNELIEKTTPIKSTEEVYNIVTVDDSPAVLKILSKIFKSDRRYNLLQQCKDGLELAQFIKTNNQRIDLITLDLHMPNLDGVGYLEKHFNSSHPPVLVVSSVNRDNQDLAKKAIDLGAFDYVEKPNFKNFDECSEELKNKIISFLSLSDKKVTKPVIASKGNIETTPSTSQASSFSKSLKQIPLYIFTSNSSFDRIKLMLNEIYSQGLAPKHFIASSNEAIDEIKKHVTDFFKLKNQTEFLSKISFTRSLDFYITHKESLKREDAPILCLYQTTDAYTHLNQFIPFDSYILSEKEVPNTEHHVDSMPSTSWGFHVLDFINHDKFTQDTIYKWNDYEGKTHNLSYRCALVVLYNQSKPIIFIEAKNLTKSFNLLKNYLHKTDQITGYKIAGPLSLGKKIKTFLDSEKLKAINLFKTSGDSIYNFKNELLRIKAVKKEKVISPQVIKTPIESMKKNISVLIIDDSRTLTKILKKHIESDPIIKCTSIHHDVKNIERDIQTQKPDVITLDMNMPEMDGAEIFDRIIKKYNIPTILLTASEKNSKKVLKALNSGVLDYIQKPAMNELTSSSFPLIQMIKDASISQSSGFDMSKTESRISSRIFANSLILIGASTGGTRAISYLLSNFPRTIPPVIIGQHIPAGYSQSFAELLNEKNPFNVKEASNGEEVLSNNVYIAPGGKHLSVRKDRTSGKLFFVVTEFVDGAKFTPSIDHLFSSFTQISDFNIVATILTGMGKDGALSLKKLKERGSFTLAQDKESSVVYGMPRAAWELGAADQQLSLDKMAGAIFDGLSHLNKKAS